jgi:plasmid maintenance system antidote protein VapI
MRKKPPARKAPISRALRNIIRERGLTAYATAQQAGVSVDSVQRFLKHQRGLTLATVDKLTAALDLTLCPEDPPDGRNAPAAR